MSVTAAFALNDVVGAPDGLGCVRRHFVRVGARLMNVGSHVFAALVTSLCALACLLGSRPGGIPALACPSLHTL